MTTLVIDVDGLSSLFKTLEAEGYTLVGPTVADQAIVYDTVHSPDDLPRGVTDVQEGGRYRLEERADDARFGYNIGPTSWKRYLFPPRTELLRARRRDGRLVFETSEENPPSYAFIGVRPCELAAIAIQDRVFMGSGRVDRTYASRRAGVFMVAVNCGQAGATCFCASMGTGPRATDGYDLVLTELIEAGGPRYVVETGSARGETVAKSLPGGLATEDDLAGVASAVARAESEVGRRLDTNGIRDLLVENPDHPRWDEVAERCLTCGNCTLACPTCFCSTTEDAVTLDGTAVRSRRWDSCFGLDFSGLHGHPVRSSAKSRYRQWMTHKLATWHDQFGTSGCVGCGRCITWCPVGIDITAEVAAIRETVRA
ncbi:MAG TPA: 4Fe-4S dicluster domain-containing protein [Acidimicrobiia bacterium]|nr:4Fe-4S dicluster domain-containing protein [Acidimicrobiia bacterium]